MKTGNTSLQGNMTRMSESSWFVEFEYTQVKMEIVNVA